MERSLLLVSPAQVAGTGRILGALGLKRCGFLRLTGTAHISHLAPGCGRKTFDFHVDEQPQRGSLEGVMVRGGSSEEEPGVKMCCCSPGEPSLT